jgi:purine-binding chemotaxis protein CheW
MRGETLELLCFQLCERVLAIDIMGIREILRSQKIIPVPEAPPHIAGVLNLRGELMPVVDLHTALPSAPERGSADDPKLVVVRTGRRTAAILVDRVLEVVSVPLAELTPVPGSGPSGDATVVAAFRKELDGSDSSVVLLSRLGALLAEEVSLPAGGPS